MNNLYLINYASPSHTHNCIHPHLLTKHTTDPIKHKLSMRNLTLHFHYSFLSNNSVTPEARQNMTAPIAVCTSMNKSSYKDQRMNGQNYGHCLVKQTVFPIHESKKVVKFLKNSRQQDWWESSGFRNDLKTQNSGSWNELEIHKISRITNDPKIWKSAGICNTQKLYQ